MKQPHQILGVRKHATEEEVRAAWRGIARDTHPDRNPSPNAARDFIEARAAYEWMLSHRSYAPPSATTTREPLMIGGPTPRVKTPVNWERYLREQMEAEARYGWLGEWDRSGYLRNGALPRRRRKRRNR